MSGGATLNGGKVNGFRVNGVADRAVELERAPTVVEIELPAGEVVTLR